LKKKHTHTQHIYMPHDKRRKNITDSDWYHSGIENQDWPKEVSIEGCLFAVCVQTKKQASKQINK
jgi:hypothetical protein